MDLPKIICQVGYEHVAAAAAALTTTSTAFFSMTEGEEIFLEKNGITTKNVFKKKSFHATP